MWFGFFLSVTLTLLAMATLVPSTRRGMRKGRIIRRRNAIIALEYSGEVVGKAPSPADTGARYGGVGPHVDVTIRREDETVVIASLPILFDSRFPMGSHVVKRSGRLWPDAAYGLRQDPDEDRSG